MTRVLGIGQAALAAALALALAAGDAGAGPFRIVTDGPESVWVLDAGSGKLTWCRLAAPSGPDVLDVAGTDVQARPATPRRPRPVCTVALRPAPSEGGAVRVGRFGYGSYGAGYGGLGGGYGRGAVDVSDGRVLIVRPKTVNINTY